METSQIAVLNKNENKALIAGVKNGKIAIPLSSIVTIENVAASEINTVNFDDVIYLRGEIIPLVYMDKMFKLDNPEETMDRITVIICSYKDTYVGLVVDELFEQEIIEQKSLGILSDNRFFDGAAIFDDAIALIVNVESLIA